MWRYDAARSAASGNEVPSDLHLIWSKSLTARRQAWDDPLNLDLMTYDRVFEPIVLDGRLFIGFNDTDKLLALDAENGNELWSFYAEAPVRLPPVGWQGRVYFCSDDGFLYCVNAESGELVWKFRGAPSAQHAIGNRRLTSAWPARGGPVVKDDVVYFAASIWPFMGTFIYALDAQTGDVVWVNDRTGSQYIKQPHSAPSFAGVAPQGSLVATESALLVPGGRSVPAVFDRRTGQLQYFEINAGGKGTGGSFVAADETHFYVHTRQKGTRAFNIDDGIKTAFMPSEPVLAGELIYSAETHDGKSVVRAYDDTQSVVWELEADGSGDLILAKDKLVAAGGDAITIIGLDEEGRDARIVNSIPVDNRGATVNVGDRDETGIERLIVANQTLFAVTLDGRLMAFGSDATDFPPRLQQPNDARSRPIKVAEDDSELLLAGDAEGYAIWFGSWQSTALQSLAAKSPFTQLSVVMADAGEVDFARHQLDEAGLYGRVTAHHSRADTFMAPDYIAHMVFVDLDSVMPEWDGSLIRRLYRSVRPYGGVMHLLASGRRDMLRERLSKLNLEQAKIERTKHGFVLRREGRLPGTADWTHQYGNIANTVKSDDRRVKLPLGILWFGGSSNMDVLPRHGHGPPEQVIGGRLFIQGMNCLSARDVYTGRVLWKREFEDLGTFDVYYDDTYDNTPLNPKYNQVHIPGANGRGTNYVVTDDFVYLVEGGVCHGIDPGTGKTLKRFQLPTDETGDKPQWGYIGVYRDVLLAGIDFANYRTENELTFPADKELKKSKAGFGTKSLDRAASVSLAAFDRHSGEKLWQVKANHSFWHNGIVAGGDQVYCLDRNPKKIEDALRRRGRLRTDDYRIVALDFRTGEVNWEITEGIFGTWLGYSQRHDLLLQAGAKASDRLYDEVDRGMTVYECRKGTVRWKNDSLKYAGPCILHNDLIITNANSYSESAGAFHLLTGKPKLIENPLTGELQPWKVTRAYGCNNIIASENLLTFRSGAAGFYDLQSQSGTGNLGGFKSGCTSNLVVANGVLNAPDYTRTCSCAYQNQTSLGLVHMPDVELWSVNAAASMQAQGKRLDKLGINFGAPGDRRDDRGVLWIEHPVVAGTSPPVSIELSSEADYFQRHSSTMSGSAAPWVLASGVRGVSDVRIDMKLAGQFDVNNGIPIEHVDDDAEEDENGEVNLKSSDLELVEDSKMQIVGLRFNDVAVDRGTEIRSAHLQFTCDEPSNKLASLIIAAEDTADSAPFSADDHDLSARSRTKAEVTWEPDPWKKKFESSDIHRTPDLAAMVQEIIDRPDWEPGNSLSFLITGSGKRTAVAGQPGNERSPKLILDAEPSKSRSEEKQTSLYDIELYFATPHESGESLSFDVLVNDQPLGSRILLDPADDQKRHVIHRLEGVAVADELRLRMIPQTGSPVLSGISIVRSDKPGDE